MKKKMIKNIEWGILVCTLLLVVIGLVALFSATQNLEYEEYKKKALWLVISIPVMIFVIAIEYEFYFKISPILYGASILLLIAVMFTEPIYGATSWFIIGPFSFQPAEFAKIVVVLFTTDIIVRLQKNGKDEINRLRKLGIIIIKFSVPGILNIKQPD